MGNNLVLVGNTMGNIVVTVQPLTDENREDVLILDDTPYDRSRSKQVELLSRVHDHSAKRYLTDCH